eukprot:GILI01024599.1.p1 GENE.GILI01024599.1~~GILI01024599.1.p1  ORF type:complete len:139 (-),score=34.97 GILI01024599.1:269-649(-)
MPSYISSAFLFAALACGASAAVLKAKETASTTSTAQPTNPPYEQVVVGGCTDVCVYVEGGARVPIYNVYACWNSYLYCGEGYFAGIANSLSEAIQLAITSFQQNSSAPCLNLTTAPPQLKAAAKKP